jgi:hypothetical protein
MKQILSAITLFALFLCSSCGNSGGSTTATSGADTAKAAVTDTLAAPVKPVFKPFDVVEIRHMVKDFGKWKTAFDVDSTNRNAAGLGFMIIGKEVSHPNNIEIVLSVSDLQKAKDFAASPKLKDVMKKNGVISVPDIKYLHIDSQMPYSPRRSAIQIPCIWCLTLKTLPRPWRDLRIRH